MGRPARLPQVVPLGQCGLTCARCPGGGARNARAPSIGTFCYLNFSRSSVVRGLGPYLRYHRQLGKGHYACSPHPEAHTWEGLDEKLFGSSVTDKLMDGIPIGL